MYVDMAAPQVFGTYVPYYPLRGVEFMCLCISAIMVLNRLLNHALDSRSQAAHPDLPSQNTLMPTGGKLWLLTFRAASFIVLSFAVVGFCCGIADAVFYNAQQEHMLSAANAANATSGKDTPQSLIFKQYSDAAGFFQADARTAQHVCEVAPMHMLILMFIVVGRKRCAPPSLVLLFAA
jgi:hypothetical protein